MLRLRDGFSSRAIARELKRSPSSVVDGFLDAPLFGGKG